MRNVLGNRQQQKTQKLPFKSNTNEARKPSPERSEAQPPQTQLQKDLINYKNIQKKILNTKFISIKSEFKNPNDTSTFGNRNLQDKFDRNIIGYTQEICKKPNHSPAPGEYNSKPTCFNAVRDPTSLPTIGKAERNID